MKIAVVGLGHWGPQFVRSLVTFEEVDELMACDLDPSRVKTIVDRFPGVHGTTRLEDVLQDREIDAVILATPVNSHADLGRSVLEARKSVLIEKPLATSTQAAEELVHLASDKGVLVSVGHTLLHSPPVQHIKHLIEEGSLGTPLYVQSSRVNLGIHQSDASVIWDLAPHDLSMILHWLEDRVVEVSASGRASLGTGPADVAFIDLTFESGCIANVHLSWLAPTKLRRTTIVGSRRMIVYEDTNYEEPIKIYDKGVTLPDPEDFGQFKAVYRAGDVVSPRVATWEPLHAELQEFLNRVRTHPVPDDRERAAIEVVRITEAAEKSLSIGGELVRL